MRFLHTNFKPGNATGQCSQNVVTHAFKRNRPLKQTAKQRTTSYLQEEDVDSAELLRELNSSRTIEETDSAWIEDEDAEEEEDSSSSSGRGSRRSGSWGLEGIEAFARAKLQEEGLSIEDDAVAEGYRSGRLTAWGSAAPKGTFISTIDPSTVQLDPVYANRNSSVVIALGAMGLQVKVGRPEDEDDLDDDDGEEEEEEEEQGRRGQNKQKLTGRRKLKLGGGRRGRQAAAAESDEDDDEDDDLMGLGDDGVFDVEEDSGFQDNRQRSGPSGGEPSTRSSSQWYSQLEAAGFSVVASRNMKEGSSAAAKAARQDTIIDPLSGIFLERRVSIRASGVKSRGHRRTAQPILAEAGLIGFEVPEDDLSTLAALKKVLLSVDTVEEVLDLVALLYPYWSANGCRLVHPPSGNLVASPSPAIAARFLMAVARGAKQEHMSNTRCLQLCQDTRVLGLVECLRVAPPRLVQEQTFDMELQMKLSWVAKGYWLGEEEPQGGIGEPSTSGRKLPGTFRAEGLGPTSSEDMVLSGMRSLDVTSEYKQLLSRYQGGAGNSKEKEGAIHSHVTDEGESAMLACPQEIQQTKANAFTVAVWSLSVLGGPLMFQPEMEALMRVARFGTWQLTWSDMADVAWALAHARHWTPRLSELEGCLIKAGGLSYTTPAETSRILWAFATLGHTPEGLLKAFKANWEWRLAKGRKMPKGMKTKGDIKGFTSSQLASSLWALSVIGQVNSQCFISAWQEVKARGQAEFVALGDIALMQLWQAAMSIKYESNWAQALPEDNPKQELQEPAKKGLKFSKSGQQEMTLGIADELQDSGVKKLLQEARASFLRQTTALRKKVHSSYQRSIANALTKLRTMHLLEDNSSGYAVDLSLPGAKIAIEADGPTHVSRTNLRHMLGGTAMKRRHLQKMGWHVINITFKEWDDLASADRRQAFLQQAISEALDSKINHKKS
ncbi:hypothetical protein CEUSTIGMA_g8054.t1 [Chlamydomonas eustigma]|uniref:RAP domain-containing protein n=1 Tax=Chlamydomonas eustigma TaxID=1157962 RepID=A0A250XCJ6_9CHLO|nr:hypothetical protein CEUSTIGMA_g8054.t1 [Chlamydomonas eustigma]|eukprot:GAX80619.1 hypothetical protein CEUSTIGMA_g8054.t1 [Chlamydomonas eustigma]